MVVPQSEVDPYPQLNEPRIVAGRDDASEVAGIGYAAGVRVDAAPGRCDHVEVADRIIEVYVVEEIEELGAKFKVFLLR